MKTLRMCVVAGLLAVGAMLSAGPVDHTTLHAAQAASPSLGQFSGSPIDVDYQ